MTHPAKIDRPGAAIIGALPTEHAIPSLLRVARPGIVGSIVDTSGAAFRVGVPVRLQSASYYAGGAGPFDVSLDGTTFLMIKEDSSARPPNTPIVMMLNAMSSLTARGTGR